MAKLTELLVGEGGLLRVRGLLALGTTGVVLAMFLQELAIPAALLTAWAGITGVYFGGRFGGSK